MQGAVGSELGRLRRVWTRRSAVLGVAAIFAYGISRSSGHAPFTAFGDPLPLPPPGQLTETSADDFEGILVGLRGKPVIVNVWASWCPPCRTETPLLERTWEAHRDRVTIVGVASKDVAAEARRFMAEFGVSYTNIFDGSGDIRSGLGLRGFPTTYVFGSDGLLRTTIVGGLTEQRLAAVLADVR